MFKFVTLAAALLLQLCTSSAAAAPAAATATTTSIPDVTVPKGFPTSVVPGSVGNATCEAAYSKSINILITCGWNPDGTTNVAVVGASICVCGASNLPVIESLPIVCNNVASTKLYVDAIKTVIPGCSYLNQVGTIPDTVETAASSAAQSSSVASSNVGAIVGATLAGVALLSVIVGSLYWLHRKKKAGKEDEMAQQHLDRSDRSETMSISAAQQQQQQQQQQSSQGSNRNSNGGGGTGSGGPQSDALSSRASASTPLLRLDSIVTVLPQKTAPSTSSEHESSSNQSMFSLLSGGGAAAAVSNVGRFHPARDGDEKKGWSKGNKAQGLFGSIDSSYKEVEPETWSVAQAVLWVKELGYAVEIQKAFQDASVDGAFLKVMGKSQEACKESLKNDLGVENVRSRALLADAILSLFEVEASGFEPPGYSEL
ncbi:hypothetical protein BJ741DRAFT_593847 [Chytriomyces cf. hyalinus JEL632]|nr:hypothetical protein BJ741DRAFT_593847 [Chytriomyces cf. hyalinus JEL632]